MIEQLKRLWAEGYSAGEICRALGYGTRCAVIGKIGRLGLQRRNEKRSSKPLRLAGQPPAARVRKRKPAPPVLMRRPMPINEPHKPVELRPLRIMELHDGQCRWPLGEFCTRAEWFCGADCDDREPYCREHMRARTAR